ncbi:MAG: biopolymer transporter ExbD [Alphaproteobacteria bacterium]|nr:biopolymer transporter ExbD [Alphaproteobacteria bacterium]
MSEINVTPFVDVMLVLLVVFMVTAPLLVLGIPVQLPKVGKEFIIADQDQPLNVEVDQDKRIYLNKTEITLGKLAAQLRGIRTANPKVKVHLRGDARLNYGAIAVIAGEIRNAGIQVIALRTDLATLEREIEAFPAAVATPSSTPPGAPKPGGG